MSSELAIDGSAALTTTGSTEEPSHSILDEIDPRSTLPAHLQGTTYARDIWNRLKAHPVQNPKLKRDELATDPETRELVHAIMEVANEREKEVLLHNQARLFQELLRRVIGGVGIFLRTPL